MIDVRDFGDLTGAKDLPDSRRQHWRPTISGPCGIMAEVFCANCGHSGGLITDEWADKVFYLCQGCADTWGKLPVQEIPEELVRGHAAGNPEKI